MEWTEKDDRELAKACASTTIHHLPGQLLMDVFGNFDASNRLRMRRVSMDWNSMLTSNRLMTMGVFVDFDSRFTQQDREDQFLGLVGTGFDQWGSKEWTKRLGHALQDMANLMGQYVVKPFAESPTLYVRVGEPLRTLEELILERNSKRADVVSRLSGKCLALLLRYSHTERIVLCDCILKESFLIIHAPWLSSGSTLEATENYGDDQYSDWILDKMQVVGDGVNRPEWANVFVEELSFRNCQIVFELEEYGKPAKATGMSLTIGLENQSIGCALICAARDLYSPPPPAYLRSKYVERIQNKYRDKEAKSGDAAALVKKRTNYLRRFVNEIPEEIGDKSSASIDFFGLKASSLFLLDQWLPGPFV